MDKVCCIYCNKIIGKNNLIKHLLSHPEYRAEHPEYIYTCKYCGRTFYRKESWSTHEPRCKSNPNHTNFKSSWNKGLTAESHTSIEKGVKKLKLRYEKGELIGSFKGKSHNDATKKKISESMKGNTNNNPNKTGRGKRGVYKGIYCSSTYELAFLIYCLDHNINIKRFEGYYNYTYKGKSHKYFPDFIIDDCIYEIKGYWTEVVDIKTAAVTDRPIKVLYRKDLKYVFDYIYKYYGKIVDKNIQDLYEATSEIS